MKDIMGKALLDYQAGLYSEDLITATHISDEDVLPLPYLFRTYGEMPKLEQRALQLATGRVLDVGCAAGGHSLYLQDRGLDVTGIDISEGAIAVCKARGLKKAFVRDVLVEEGQYDTVISLMNGTGIFRTVKDAPIYLKKMKSLLKPGGQILIDSSDLSYMYDDDHLEDLKRSGPYYGELDYYLSYKGESEDVMTWLYTDFNTLKTLCAGAGLNCQLIMEGDHYDYLARITPV